MKIDIKIDGDLVIVKTNENEIKYSHTEGANLTGLIEGISNSAGKIEIMPNDFEQFKEEFKGKEIILIKIAQYIYKIIEAFNESYEMVYEPTEVNEEELCD